MSSEQRDSNLGFRAEEAESVEALNQVEITTQSGETHWVRFAIRHPRRDWIYAQRAVNRGDEPDEEYDWNDLVFGADTIESIESDEISFGDHNQLDFENQFLRIHHSEPVEDIPFGLASHKAFIPDGAGLEEWYEAHPSH
jgi:hypothetical protein